MHDHLPENYLDSLKNSRDGRNDLGHNPEVLFQSFAFEKSIIRSLYPIPDLSILKVLDVGCGEGGSLLNLIRLGFKPDNLSGIDILSERIKKAQVNLPNTRFITGDAANMPFPDNNFDLVMESTMFIQLKNDELCRLIADEMIRVTKKDGFILLIDWRYSKPWNKRYRGLSLKRVKTLFGVGSETKIITKKNGALVPPIGRFCSKYSSSLYFIIQSVFPFFVGQVTYLIQKNKLTS